MTEEDHAARAALMGMKYHDGNGIPFYYVVGDDGIPDMLSFIDPDTLEPMIIKEKIDGDQIIYTAPDKVRKAMGAGFWPPIENPKFRRKR